jgi:hypothetical protein
MKLNFYKKFNPYRKNVTGLIMDIRGRQENSQNSQISFNDRLIVRGCLYGIFENAINNQLQIPERFINSCFVTPEKMHLMIDDFQMFDEAGKKALEKTGTALESANIHLFVHILKAMLALDCGEDGLEHLRAISAIVHKADTAWQEYASALNFYIPKNNKPGITKEDLMLRRDDILTRIEKTEPDNSSPIYIVDYSNFNRHTIGKGYIVTNSKTFFEDDDKINDCNYSGLSIDNETLNKLIREKRAFLTNDLNESIAIQLTEDDKTDLETNKPEDDDSRKGHSSTKSPTLVVIDGIWELFFSRGKIMAKYFPHLKTNGEIRSLYTEFKNFFECGIIGPELSKWFNKLKGERKNVELYLLPTKSVSDSASIRKECKFTKEKAQDLNINLNLLYSKLVELKKEEENTGNKKASSVISDFLLQTIKEWD